MAKKKAPVKKATPKKAPVKKAKAVKKAAPKKAAAEVPSFALGQIGRKHRKWIGEHQTGTLQELIDFLDEVQNEFMEFDGDTLLVDVIGDLSVSADYLEEWDGRDGLMATADERWEDAEEDKNQAQELLDHFGNIKIKDLPQSTGKKTARKPAKKSKK